MCTLDFETFGLLASNEHFAPSPYSPASPGFHLGKKVLKGEGHMPWLRLLILKRLCSTDPSIISFVHPR